MSYISTGALISSNDQTWETPKYLFDWLNDIFHFTIDLASFETCYTAKTIGKCITPQQDSLKQSWNGQIGFLNPPYGRELHKWVEKACAEVKKATKPTMIIMLIPSRTDTSYWHDYIFPTAKEIWFLKGRVRFGDGTKPAPFPSAIVVFSNEKTYNSTPIFKAIEQPNHQ